MQHSNLSLESSYPIFINLNAASFFVFSHSFVNISRNVFQGSRENRFAWAPNTIIVAALCDKTLECSFWIYDEAVFTYFVLINVESRNWKLSTVNVSFSSFVWKPLLSCRCFTEPKIYDFKRRSILYFILALTNLNL